MTKLRILLAEDHQVMREGLRMIVNGEASMEVVGEADTGAAAVALVQQLRPDVVVMDISMPTVNGLRATQILKTLLPDTRILILSRHTDSSYVQQLLRSGAKGYVLKRSASGELIRAIRRVAAGQSYLDPAVTEQVVGTIAGGSVVADSATKPLSRREEDVLRLIALGFLSREIALHLRISIKTVETHKANAMGKMGLKNRIDIVRYAMLRGWLTDT